MTLIIQFLTNPGDGKSKVFPGIPSMAPYKLLWMFGLSVMDNAVPSVSSHHKTL
jgi:hypothetical protein